jgi:hypothetical protein
MLTRFEVENFYSVHDRQVLSLAVPRNAPAKSGAFRPLFPGSRDRATVVAAIFGPNASGKTNVLRALSFVINFLRGSVVWEKGKWAPLLTFQSRAAQRKPIRFRCEAIAALVEGQPPCKYSYELVIKDPTDAAYVDYESISYFPRGRKRRLIERTRQSFTVSADFALKSDDQRLGFIAEGTSAISTLAKFNHQPSTLIVAALNTVQTNVASFVGQNPETLSFPDATKYYLSNPKVLEALRARIRLMDLGIEDVSVEISSKQPVVRFHHVGLDSPIADYFESDGTKSFFGMFPLLNYVLEAGGLALIDEFDRDIHPLLLPELVRWFEDRRSNPKDAQLIFTCHNASLLEHLQKEEVFLTEKNAKGHTQLYALKDVEGVRRDVSLYKKYIGGALGAVPRLG